MKPDDKLYPYSCIYAKFHDSIPLVFRKSKLLYTKDVIMWTGTYIIALQYVTRYEKRDHLGYFFIF